MDSAKFLKQYVRICRYYAGMCSNGCPLYISRIGCGIHVEHADIDNCIRIIEQWSKEHPVKTRQSEFLKMFPNASIGYNGTLVICPSQADTKAIVGCVRSERNCDKCKRDFWLKEIE